MWQKRVDKNRELISNLLESNLPIGEVYDLVRRLSEENEAIIKNKLE